MASSYLEALDGNGEETESGLDNNEAMETKRVIEQTRPKLRVVKDNEADNRAGMEADADALAKVFMDILEPAEFKHNS
jgi:hypothetical protein